MDRSRGGDRGADPPPLENHKWLKVSLKIHERTPLEKQLDWVQLLLEGGLYGPCEIVKYVD